MDVYLDAVFFPNCVRDPRTFAQEGWHYELEEPEVPTALLGKTVLVLQAHCASRLACLAGELVSSASCRVFEQGPAILLLTVDTRTAG